MSRERCTAWVTGRVQGVGFRWWVRARALELGLAGWASNRDDGRVEVVAEGPAEALDALMALLEPGGPGADHRPERPGRVDRLVTRRSAERGLPEGFVER